MAQTGPAPVGRLFGSIIITHGTGVTTIRACLHVPAHRADEPRSAARSTSSCSCARPGTPSRTPAPSPRRGAPARSSGSAATISSSSPWCSSPRRRWRSARRAIYAGTNALADALVAHAPPERPVAFDWPDAIRIDGVLVGGGRLGWPDGVGGARGSAVAGLLRHDPRLGAPRRRARLAAAQRRAGRARLRGDRRGRDHRELRPPPDGRGCTNGATPASRRSAGAGSTRLPAKGGERFRLADNGDLLVYRGLILTPGERRSLARALAAPSWLDPATGAPWL